jgi:hypothetical protein
MGVGRGLSSEALDGLARVDHFGRVDANQAQPIGRAVLNLHIHGVAIDDPDHAGCGASGLRMRYLERERCQK